MKWSMLFILIPIWLLATIQTAIFYPHTDTIQLFNIQIDFVWYSVPAWQNWVASILCLGFMIGLTIYYDKWSEKYGY